MHHGTDTTDVSDTDSIQDEPRTVGNGKPEPLIMKKKPELESSDQTFVDKLIQYITTIEGASNDIKIATNQSFKNKYVVQLSNLPKMKLNDFTNIEMLSMRFKNIYIYMAENRLEIEIWKTEESKKTKKRKLTHGCIYEWNLENVSAEDKKMVKNILNSFADMETIECQFHADLQSEPPNYYIVRIMPMDKISYFQLKDIRFSYRTFIDNIIFDFPKNIIELKIQRVSSSSRYRRKLVIKRP
jgi:hypothetical protein